MVASEVLLEALDLSLWARNMVEGGGVLGLKDGDGVARVLDNQEKRCPVYNNRWLSLVTLSLVSSSDSF